MRRYLLIAAGLLALLSPAKAADSTVPAMTAAGALSGTELLYCVQSAADRKCTPAQLSTYIQSLISGDCTVSGNVITCPKINGVTFPSSGTSGGVPYFSAAGAISSSAALGANLPVIGGGAGVAPSTGTRSGNTTAFATVTGTLTSGRCVQIDANGNFVQASGACGTSTPSGSSGQVQYNNAGAFGGFTFSGDVTVVPSTGVATLKNTGPGATGPIGTATAVPTITIDAQGRATALTSTNIQDATAAQKGLAQCDGTTITCASAVISAVPATAAPSVQTGTNYGLLTGDRVKVTYLSNASAQTPTIAQAGTTGFEVGKFWQVCNINTGIQTITPATSTIGGAASYALLGGTALAPKCVTIISDGTNYTLFPAGTTQTIASGTSALGTGAISSATCATVVTTSATGVATTDVVSASFNGDPTAVTGYVPLTAGMLTIIGYPTANNVNFKVCNNTSSSITPGALTLNWRVVR